MSVIDNLSCEVIEPQDERYEAARAIWNGSIDHRPAAIARPRTDAEVAEALLRARDQGADIAVRGGGHSMQGHSMSDGGVTIDLSAMNRVEVDLHARRARVGGGALLGDVARATGPQGLAIPYGHVSHTGVAGLTLGGGIGWITRRHGLAIDRLRAARVVTADGEVVRASDDENPDLFWGLRGGGGNFGIVTEFEFELCEHGPDVLAGLLLHPLERAGEALRFSRDFMDMAPDDLTIYETFMTVPPEPPFPEELRGKPALAIGIVFAADPDDGERVLRPLREFGPPALDAVGRMPVIGAQEMLDPTAPHGMRNYSKSHWLAELPDAAIDRMVELHQGVPSPMSMIITARMGGAIERVAPESTAFVHRDAYRLLWVVGSWWEGDDAEQIAWTREVFDALTPHSTGGVYVNSLQDEPEQRIRDAYDNGAWARLVELKDRWDPDNAFRLGPPLERLHVRFLSGESGGLGALELGNGQQVVAAELVPQSLERFGCRARRVRSSARELDCPLEGEQRGAVGIAVARALEPVLESLGGELDLAAGEVEANHRRHGPGAVLAPGQQLCGLLEPSLADPQLGEPGQPGQGVGLAQAAELVERGHELTLGIHPVAACHQEVGVDGAAPARQGQIVSPPGEVRDGAAEVAGTAHVGELLAGHQRDAAGLANRQRVLRLPGNGDRHCLVEDRHPVLYPPL